MTDYKKYINALRKCAKEHENDRTSFGHIIVSDLCRDTANLLESLEQEPCEDCISRKEALRIAELGAKEGLLWQQMQLSILPSVQPISKSVIEDIKADIAEFMAKIPALGNCKEGWHNAGQRIGLEQACEIIDNHIAESEE